MLCWFFETLEKSLPNKHSSWWRRLQCNIFLSSKTSWRHNCKTSCKHVLKTYCKYVLKKSWRRLPRRKVLRWRRAQDVLKTSWKTRNVCWVTSVFLACAYTYAQCLWTGDQNGCMSGVKNVHVLLKTPTFET